MGGLSCALLLVLSLVGVRVSRTDSSNGQLLGVETVSLPGALGDVNQVRITGDGRYALVAPFAPVHGPDNHFVSVTDLQNPSAPPTQIDLGNYYYPTNLFVTQANMVFVRATGFDPSQPSGLPSEGILFFHLNTAADQSQPSAENITFIPINRPVGSSDNSVIPVDFGVGLLGQFVVFTNGASIDLVSLDGRYSYPITIIPDNRYQPLTDPQDTTSDYLAISRLDVDQSTDIITITVNGRTQGTNYSNLYFYQMFESGPNYGNVNLLKLVTFDELPAGTSMTPGSNATSPDGRYGYFVVDNGALCRVALDGDTLGTQVDVLGSYASIAAQDPANRGPRLLQYDKLSKHFGIVNRGNIVRVRRPGNVTRPAYISGRGRVTRPAYVAINEVPGLVLGTIGFDGLISNTREFADFGTGEIGISSIVFDCNGAALFTNYSGNLISIGNGGATGMGKSVARIGQLALSADGTSLVGISSFSLDAAGNQDMTNPGALVIMNIQDPPINTP
ncbi:MAG TPA: hypothetical protein VEZ90_13115 [Blastocatellia bacterium]|nr:hypothetical protein [Blastocatellia bacterium]